MRLGSYIALALAGFGAVAIVTGAKASDLPSDKSAAALPAPDSQFQLYARGQVGGAWLADDKGYWIGPGAGDPKITESLNNPASFTGGAAVGLQFFPGLRADLSYDYLGYFSVHGNPIAPNGGVGHASMDAGVTSNLLMGNLFVEPLRFVNVDTGFVQPFVTAGVGVAFNDFGDWSRTNPAAPGPLVRTFSGASFSSLAWAVGGGLSFDVSNWISHAAFVDLTYRYIDAGHVSGGSVPISDKGASPRQPFNFELATNVATVGLRVPF